MCLCCARRLCDSDRRVLAAACQGLPLKALQVVVEEGRVVVMVDAPDGVRPAWQCVSLWAQLQHSQRCPLPVHPLAPVCLATLLQRACRSLLHSNFTCMQQLPST